MPESESWFAAIETRNGKRPSGYPRRAFLLLPLLQSDLIGSGDVGRDLDRGDR